MSGSRAKAIRRDVRRMGLDPLSRETERPTMRREVWQGDKGVGAVDWPLPAHNRERRVYRTLKRVWTRGR